MYSHLSLLLTLKHFAALSEEEFTSPTNPGPFTPPEKGTEAQIRAACEVWKEALYTLHLCQAVERALISQVVAVVESPYLAACGTQTQAVIGTVFLSYYNIYRQHTVT